MNLVLQNCYLLDPIKNDHVFKDVFILRGDLITMIGF